MSREERAMLILASLVERLKSELSQSYAMLTLWSNDAPPCLLDFQEEILGKMMHKALDLASVAKTMQRSLLGGEEPGQIPPPSVN